MAVCFTFTKLGNCVLLNSNPHRQTTSETLKCFVFSFWGIYSLLSEHLRRSFQFNVVEPNQRIIGIVVNFFSLKNAILETGEVAQ